MFVYEAFQYEAAEQFGLGQVTVASIVDPSTKQLTKDAANATVLLLSSRYATSTTGSGRIINGQPVLQPAIDPDADYYTFVATMAGSGMTALDQLKTRKSGWLVLVDADKLAAIMGGAPIDLSYAIVKDDATAKVLIQAAAASGQNLAIVPASAIPSAAIQPAGGAKKEFSVVTPLVGAGIGFVVGGGPTGALVGAAIGAGVEYFRTQQKTA